MSNPLTTGRNRVTISDTAFESKANQIAREADERKELEKAKPRCRTIVDDEDGRWLLDALKRARGKSAAIRLNRDMRFHFLGDSAEAVLNGQDDETYAVIDMPEGSIVRKTGGAGYGTWVFRVENNRLGTQYQSIDVAYRKVGQAQLLYLRKHQRGEPQRSGRRAGGRIKGRGPDRSF
jgi:hypothetical protein